MYLIQFKDIFGLTIASYKAEKAKNDKVIANTAAAVLETVRAEDINVVSVSDRSTNAASQRNSRNKKKTNSITPEEEDEFLLLEVFGLLDTALNVIYTVTVPDVAKAGFSDANEAYKSLLTNLEQKVSGNEFNDKLLEIAELFNSTSLMNATVSKSISISNFTSTVIVNSVPIDAIHDDNEDTLSAGEIGGIIVGSIAVLILFIACIYCGVITKCSRDNRRMLYVVPLDGIDDRPIELDDILSAKRKPKAQAAASRTRLTARDIEQGQARGFI